MAEHVVQSPLPGVFYRPPAPDQPPFVEEGHLAPFNPEDQAFVEQALTELLES